MSHKKTNERGWVGQVTEKLNETDCIGRLKTVM